MRIECPSYGEAILVALRGVDLQRLGPKTAAER